MHILSEELNIGLDAFLKRCYRYGFRSKIEHADILFDGPCIDLFHKIRPSGRCLHGILPPVTSQCYDMCQRPRTFVLPQCNSVL